MEREDLELYRLIREKIEDYGLEYILEVNDVSPEEAIFQLVKFYGLELPE
jgi:hypothetical protein